MPTLVIKELDHLLISSDIFRHAVTYLNYALGFCCISRIEITLYLIAASDRSVKCNGFFCQTHLLLPPLIIRSRSSVAAELASAIA